MGRKSSLVLKCYQIVCVVSAVYSEFCQRAAGTIALLCNAGTPQEKIGSSQFCWWMEGTEKGWFCPAAFLDPCSSTLLRDLDEVYLPSRWTIRFF